MKSYSLLLVLFSISLSTLAQRQQGKASFYADKFEGRTTASGEKYKHSKRTAAHKTLPFGTRVRVTNLSNQKQVEVIINDRGPYVDDRIIDLSKSAAEELGFVQQGLAEVTLEVIDAGDGKSVIPGPMPDVAPPEEKEFYDVEAKRMTPGGFGVQIGTYQELVNLLRVADNLKSSYQKKVTVQVKNVNGAKYYALILGGFSTRAKAEKFKEKIRNKYPDAFIAEFERMR
ncbi:MAG: septal ring lytic transglycosylase RlpA family protein [Cyclobacteriaceae bacterium]|nr:septal ring lytic transglycosylase RlpA family protein [Cyclobacteriaceae bacterium]